MFYSLLDRIFVAGSDRNGGLPSQLEYHDFCELIKGLLKDTILRIYQSSSEKNDKNKIT